MEPPAHLGHRTAERWWITHGPNSEGIRGWLLWRGHLFPFEHWGSGGNVEPGIPVRAFLDRSGDTDDASVRRIVEALRAMDG